MDPRIPAEREPANVNGATIGLEGSDYAGYRLVNEHGPWTVQRLVSAGNPRANDPEIWADVSSGHESISAALDAIDAVRGGAAAQ